MKKEQQVLIEWLKDNYTEGADPIGTIAYIGIQPVNSVIIHNTIKLSKIEQAQAIQQFITFVLEREVE